MKKLEIKILNLSFDSESDNPESKIAIRFKDYGSLVNKYVVLTLGKQKKDFELARNVKIFTIKKSYKITNFINLFTQGLRIIKNEHINLITVPDIYFGAFLAYILSRFTKTALEIQVHGFEKFYGIRKILAKIILKKADGLRVVSVRLKNELIENFGIEEEKITVVPIFVNLAVSKRPLKDPSEPFIFLYVARLVKVKNISLGIKAFSEISKDINMELWVVGDGPLRSSLEFQVKSLKIEDKVRFFGSQENVLKFYEKADTLLLTSYKEGWPLVVIEALSFGLPIIMTPVGQAEELLKSEENALIIPQNDVLSLVKVMMSVVQNYNLRKSLSLNAERTFHMLPKKEEILKKYLESWKMSIKNNEK